MTILLAQLQASTCRPRNEDTTRWGFKWGFFILLFLFISPRLFGGGSKPHAQEKEGEEEKEEEEEEGEKEEEEIQEKKKRRRRGERRKRGKREKRNEEEELEEG